MIIKELKTKLKNVDATKLLRVQKAIDNHIKYLEKKMQFKTSTSVKDFLISRR